MIKIEREGATATDTKVKRRALAILLGTVVHERGVRTELED